MLNKIKTIMTIGLSGVFLVLVLTGCSGISVSQDYASTRRFAELKSYAWKSGTQEKTGDVRVDSPFIDSRFRNAIDRTLSAKGFRKTVNTPEAHETADFQVVYHYSIRPRITSTPSGPAIGFGFGTARSNAMFGFNSETVDISQYDEGLLVIDFLDQKDGCLLWRGICTSRIDTHNSPEDITKLFEAMVEKNLGQFPPNTDKP